MEVAAWPPGDNPSIHLAVGRPGRASARDRRHRRSIAGRADRDAVSAPLIRRAPSPGYAPRSPGYPPRDPARGTVTARRFRARVFAVREQSSADRLVELHRRGDTRVVDAKPPPGSAPGTSYVPGRRSGWTELWRRGVLRWTSEETNRFERLFSCVPGRRLPAPPQSRGVRSHVGCCAALARAPGTHQRQPSGCPSGNDGIRTRPNGLTSRRADR